MIKRVLLYFAVMAILLMVAISAGQWDKDTALLQQHADEISIFLETQHQEAEKWLQKHPDLIIKYSNQEFEERAEQQFTVLLHSKDSVLFWSNTRVLPSGQTLASLTTAPGARMLQLPLGWFWALVDQKSGYYRTILIPVRYTIDAQLSHPFPADAGISSNITVSTQATDYVVRADGKNVCWLAAQGAVQSAWLQWMQLVFYLLFFVVLLALIGQVSTAISARFGAISGVILPLLIVVVLISLSSTYNFTGRQFGALPLFAPTFGAASILGKSLGDWLISVFLLVWLMLFFHRAFQSGALSQASSTVKYGVAGVGYLLAMFSVPLGVEVFKQLVMQSNINFDFDNILNINAFGILALAGIMLLLLGLFLFNHRIMLAVRQAELPRNHRAGILAGAALLFIGICAAWPSGFMVHFMGVAAFGILYAVILDAFVHDEGTGFGWIVIWMLFFALFSSSFLYRYNNLKGKSDRLTYAEALANPRDTTRAEQLLPSVYAAFKQDTQQLNVLLKPWPFKAAETELRDYFNTRLFEQNYLFQHYRLNVYAFDRENQPLLLGQTGDYQFVVDKNWNQGKPLSGAKEIRYCTGENGKFRYMIQLRALRMGDPTQTALVFCFFDHDYPKPTKVYAQLFFNTPYKNLQNLAQYDFAVQEQGNLIVEQGQGNIGLLQDTTLNNGEGREIQTDEPYRLDAVYKSKDGLTVATVGRRAGGIIKLLYLFSILFTLASLFLFLLAFLNSYLGFLPKYFQFKLSTKGSLSKRIHFYNVTLIGASFLVIGFMTYWHFTDASREAERANLDYRADAVLANLKTQLLNATLSADSVKRTLPRTLSTIASSLSIDACLYAQNGDLRFTTQEDLAGLGILPSKMNPSAFEGLKSSKQSEHVEKEQLAGFEYFTKYLPLRNAQNQLLGYLGVPYQLGETKAGPEVSDFIGILASLYVFLLLLAYVVTYFLARSIIRPVRMISDKIRGLRLEDKNEPLEYKGDAQDELSVLVDRYNIMVDKLEASKVQMIRLEREGAWREMARQVAHDIKNPLTTMKLSMQQLERVSADPEQAAAYLRKAITRLIEQIDSLAQIASEFSMFANLDIREKHDMVLNEVVENVHDLFSEQKNVDLDLTLPGERFHILGDKNHLIRVFNNLVINAIQAIPSDRRGRIKVSLYRTENSAVVQIGDNGGGIPAEIQQRVFEPNFTTKTSGSGLGLAICKKIIEAHDGSIHFATRENEGTDFYVEMPIAFTEKNSRN